MRLQRLFELRLSLGVHGPALLRCWGRKHGWLVAALASYPPTRVVGAPGCQPVSISGCWTKPWKARLLRLADRLPVGDGQHGRLGADGTDIAAVFDRHLMHEEVQVGGVVTAYPTDCPSTPRKQAQLRTCSCSTRW